VKKNFLHSALVCLTLLAALPGAAQKNSVLSNGTWLKFSVTHTGVYRIDHQLLGRSGINPDHIDPRQLRIFAYPVGMLPQKIDVPLTDLREVAIHIEGEADGRFNRDDFILFYAEGPDRYFFREDKNLFHYQNNLYSEKNFYFVTVGSAPGKRIETLGSPGEQFEPLTRYEDFGHYETDLHNELKSGREWWGELFDTRTEIGIRFDMAGIVPGSEIRMVSSVMARSVSPSAFTVLWNGTSVVTQPMGVIPNTQWGVRGRTRTDTVSFAAAAPGASQTVTVQFTKGATNPSIGYLNFISFSATRQLEMRGATMPFVLRPAPQPKTAQLTRANAGVTVWNVQDPFDVKRQATVASGTQIQFGYRSTQPTAFVAFEPVTARPRFEAVVRNQNLHQTPPANLIILTHPDLRAAANRLAAHRRQQGISTFVASTEEVYNEFSGGRQDVSALRNYLHWLYQRPGGALQNVLLFGRGSYDYKSRVFNNTNLVPTYQSANSLHPLETYNSDDYYGFLEPGEGEWREVPAEDHTLDIGVGRLPLRTLAEANRMVDKLIRYDVENTNEGDWRRRITFVADDGDFNTHQSQASQLAEELEFRQPGYVTQKIFLDAFPQEERASGQFSPLTTRAIREAVRAGTYIVNFVGHGSEQIWMQERVLDQITVTELRNAPQWPLFVTATCEFGRADDPLLISTGELLVLRADGGAMGLVTTARPVNSATNFTLNRAFYLAFLQNEDGDLGNLFRATKNRSLSGVANRNFSLLGDPSVKFGPPTQQARITEAVTSSGSDTLRALSRIRLKGEIVARGVRQESFNGWADVAVLDKPVAVQTRGDENPPFSFFDWRHTLFRGRAAVANGYFELETVLPKNLTLQPGHGKISVIAQDAAQNAAALGAMERVWIGGTEKNVTVLPGGPEMVLFMGDTTFEAGGLVSPTTRLLGRLSDPQGINQAGYRPYTITATLDGTTEFDLCAFYKAGKNFTAGTFDFPLENLAPGAHEILVKAYDNHGNRGTQTIRFTVAGDGEISVEGLRNYPNPFTEKTTFEFVHSRSGEDLQVVLSVFNSQGQPVHSQTFGINQSNFRVVLGDWNGHSNNGIKLPAGIYYYRLGVRSMKDGALSEKFSKLILLN